MLFGGKKADPDIEARLKVVERKLQALEMDWESVLERLQARLAKLGRTRQRLEELQSEDAPSALAEAPSSNAGNVDPISRRILERRSRIVAASNRTERAQ